MLRTRTAPSRLVLPQFDDNRAERAAAIANTAQHYRFDRDNRLVDGMPPWMADVPSPEKKRPEHLRALGRLTDIAQKLWSYRLTVPPKLRLLRRLRRGPFARDERGPSSNAFAVYHELFRGHDVPWIAEGDTWRSDEAFGYQRLAGLAPLYLERVDRIPDDFRVGDDDVELAPAWPGGATIDDMIVARRLWMVRHPHVHGVRSKPGTVLASPHCLFLVRDDGKLVPVAIQLFVDSDVVFTPADDFAPDGSRTNRWLVAKMFCTNVDALMYTLFSHTTLTHLLVETFWGAVCRNLSDRHPIKAMLAPHTEATHLIGAFFRTYYARPEGELIRLHQAGFEGAWEVLRRSYADWTFDELDIPARHAKRGWDRPDEPPGYLFRDDSLHHYRLISDYCRRVVAAIYPEADLLRGDGELQALARELGDDKNGCGIRGLPTDADGGISTHEQLVKLLAGVIYQAVVQHSHVDSAAYTYFGFAPNMPLSLYLQPPRDHEVRYSDAEVAAGLPPLNDAALQFALPYGNHPFHPQPRHRLFSSFIAQFPDGFLEDLPAETYAKVREAIDTWQHELAAYGAKQDERDKTLGPAPYRFLHYKNMSNSIWY